MSILQTVMQTAARYLPDRKRDPLIDAHGYVGQGVDRVDGRLKVTGGARFTAEYSLDRLAYAAPVFSTIAKGRTNAAKVNQNHVYRPAIRSRNRATK